MRQCTKCGLVLPFPDSFFRDSKLKSGFRSVCKKCDQAVQRARRLLTEEQRERQNARQRALLGRRRANDPAYRSMKSASDRAYRQSPNGQFGLKMRKARRRAEAAEHKLTRQEWAAVLAAFDGVCAYCGVDGPMQMDHFIPLKHGGHTVAGNVVPACARCNSSKQDRMPATWCEREVFKRVHDVLHPGESARASDD